MAHVVSVNVGAERPNAAKDTPTGIHKRPVEIIELRRPGSKHGGLGSGVVGDFIGDRQHHGGDYQAVYAVSREELDWWGKELGRHLDDGMFGENLTTTGIDIDHALIGERWQVGDAVVLRVEGPRIPCGTFRMHMGEAGWLKRFVDHGLSGAYLSVERPGFVRPGETITVLSRPDHAIDVPTVFRAFYDDVEAMREVIEAGVLSDSEETAALEARLERLNRRR
ncbi:MULTISPECIES: MOSC domain-containing protein [unclassified Microbacterium]|uniref:MOSC domain-containing protein n=1 Tax=unclassified Microbacterium TaxID=2609290 RepID=UPI00203C2237|nr:MOSC domain-containing protein [Microbacterium sp. USTB-Y]